MQACKRCGFFARFKQLLKLLFQVKEAIDKMGIKCESADLQRIPKVYVECSRDDQKSNLELMEYLEGLDDVDAVHHNMKID